MSDDLVTPEALAIAAGSYVAAKVFGPSLGRLGENLLVYWERRLPAIFEKADQIALDEAIEPRRIAPGLLTKLIVDASMSSDDDEITDWWARLFLDASTIETEANRSVVYSDIMAMLGPKEVQTLSSFVGHLQGFLRMNPSYEGRYAKRGAALAIDAELEGIFETKAEFSPGYEIIRQRLEEFQIAAPVRVYEWKLPEFSPGLSCWHFHQTDWYVSRQLEFEILERSRVISRARYAAPILANQNAWVGTIGLTELGASFFEACTGKNIGDLEE